MKAETIFPFVWNDTDLLYTYKEDAEMSNG